MLTDGGAEVTLAGFRREAMPVDGAVDLGRTHNGKFVQRIWAVLRAVMKLRRHKELFQDADVIVARALEMLAIGVRGRTMVKPKPPLAYECLDIHRLLLNEGAVGKMLRWLEGWLSRRASVLITSSPAFVSSYFDPLSKVRLPVRLAENKIYAPVKIARDTTPRLARPPWRIGWFGAIRCRESLDILCNLARQNPGTIEIVIRGRPAYDQFDDFDGQIQASPGVSFEGPYNNPGDLAAIYHDVHFTWAIDMFEAGQNSSWLLPNRLYEGGAYASVAIAEKAVETGRFLDERHIGVTLEEPLAKNLAGFFATLTPDRYRALEQEAAAVPIETWIYDRSDCESLVACLRGLKR